ncbi:MAG: hypothetical protein GY838_06195 [bacterium]|nr:hypothetical protein [bacterium]
MITTCTVCQARYRLEAAKVPPRVLRVRCPDCGGVFVLDGTAPVAPEETPVAGLETGYSAPAPAAQVEQPAPPVSAYDDVPVATPATVEPPAPEPVPEDEPAVAATPPASAPVESPVSEAPAAVVDTAPAAVATAEAEPAAPTRRRRSKEEMLARALVSDILVYNRELRDTALAEGNLLEALGAEIKKSWELYKEKVTPEVANSTNHFREALNEILAEGEKVF